MALSAEQVALRKTGITGTQIARICHLSPFGGPMDAYMECLGLTEVAENDAMRWGEQLEQKVADWYARATGNTPVLPDCRTVAKVDEGWIVASCDYLINPAPRCDTFLLECKTSAWARDWGEPGTDEVPDHVLAQVTWQMLAWEVSRVDVCAALGGRPPVIYTVPFDKGFADALIERGRRFWFDHVLPRVPPIMDGSEGAREYLRQRWPTHGDKLITATPEMSDDVHDLFVYGEAMDGATADYERVKQRICDAIGENAGIEGQYGGADFRITWKRTADSERTDWEAAFRELATAYQLVTDSFRELLRLHGDEDDQKFGDVSTVSEVMAHWTTTRPGSRRFFVRRGDK